MPGKKDQTPTKARSNAGGSTSQAKKSKSKKSKNHANNSADPKYKTLRRTDKHSEFADRINQKYDTIKEKPKAADLSQFEQQTTSTDAANNSVAFVSTAAESLTAVNPSQVGTVPRFKRTLSSVNPIVSLTATATTPRSTSSAVKLERPQDVLQQIAEEAKPNNEEQSKEDDLAAEERALEEELKALLQQQQQNVAEERAKAAPKSKSSSSKKRDASNPNPDEKNGNNDNDNDNGNNIKSNTPTSPSSPAHGISKHGSGSKKLEKYRALTQTLALSKHSAIGGGGGDGLSLSSLSSISAYKKKRDSDHGTFSSNQRAEFMRLKAQQEREAEMQRLREAAASNAATQNMYHKLKAPASPTTAKLSNQNRLAQRLEKLFSASKDEAIKSLQLMATDFYEKYSDSFKFSVVEFFDGAGQTPGLQVWRVVQMTPVPLQAANIGKFKCNDCYIVLHTFQSGGVDAKRQDIHYWFGQGASQTKRAVCVFLVADLSKKLGENCSHFRELQGEESPSFLELFNNNVTYVNGGVKVECLKPVSERDKFEKRLIRVADKNQGQPGVRDSSVTVEAVFISKHSLASESAFILLASPSTLYVWYGKDANRFKRWKAFDVATRIRNYDSLCNKTASIEEIEEGAEHAQFWKCIGSEPIVADESDPLDEPILYRVEVLVDSTTGKKRIVANEIEDYEGGLSFAHISEAKKGVCFILECQNEVYVWYGKGASKAVRRYAVALAEQIRTANTNRAICTRIEEVFPAAEPALFLEKFRRDLPFFADSETLYEARRREESLTAPEVNYATDGGVDRIDVLLEMSFDESTMIDETGLGNVHIWRVDGVKQLILMDESEYGNFYSNESYIILYEEDLEEDDDEEDDDDSNSNSNNNNNDSPRDNTTEPASPSGPLAISASMLQSAAERISSPSSPNRKAPVKPKNRIPKRICYFLAGRDCEYDFNLCIWQQNFIGTYKDLPNPPVNVPLLQYKECKHFLTIFQGCLCMHQGTIKEALQNSDKYRMYRIYAPDSLRARAIEVPLAASSLNSNDIFILARPDKTGSVMWVGSKVSASKTKIAQGFLELLCDEDDVEVLREGAEPETFWQFLGVNDGSAAQQYLRETVPYEKAKLYRCTPAYNSAYRVLQVPKFTQEDLDHNGVMILDDPSGRVFVWVGRNCSNASLLLAAGNTASELAAGKKKQQHSSEPIIIGVQDGEESSLFKAFFPYWRQQTVREDFYEVRCKEREQARRKLEAQVLMPICKLIEGLPSSMFLLRNVHREVNMARAEAIHEIRAVSESLSDFKQRLLSAAALNNNAGAGAGAEDPAFDSFVEAVWAMK